MTQLLQTMATQMEELKRRTCKSQKLREQYNCCEIKNHFCSINFSNHLVVAIENWNQSSRKLKIVEVQRSVKPIDAMELLPL